MTDDRAQEVIRNVQLVVGREAKNRNVRSKAVNIVCNAINEAQQGMDLAFAAGTLATAAGVPREDSLRYAERCNNEDTKKATSDAKIYLKKALEKVSDLGQDNYKQLKQWLEKDEKTFVCRIDFFNRMRKEIKRSLKLTADKLKNPGSLRAKPKRDRSSNRAYPTLPTTE